MKVVVCWEHKGEKRFAGKLATMIRAFLRKTHPNVVVTQSSLVDNHFAPYRNDAEVLAAEAQRLLDAQEVAFGDQGALEDAAAFDEVDLVRSWGGQMVQQVQRRSYGAGDRTVIAGGGGGSWQQLSLSGWFDIGKVDDGERGS